MLFNIIFYVLIIAILAGTAMFAFSDDVDKTYFGYRLYTVKTASMTPRKDGSSPAGGFKAGDAILVKRTAPEDIKVGDIITYVPGNDGTVFLTHRVIDIVDHIDGISGLFFITKGDANDTEDPPVSSEAVFGVKTMTIPNTGKVLDFIRNHLILCLVIVAINIGYVLLMRKFFSYPGKKKEHKGSDHDQRGI